ncbi:MAG: alpha-galactosidase [Lachnospiraceae bacterium]
MSIVYDGAKRILTLTTKHTTYQMKADDLGVLWHLYYGRRANGQDFSYQYIGADVANSGQPYEMKHDRMYSLDTFPQEYPSYGVGDYRLSGAEVVNADGSRCADFRYVSHEIRNGKYSLPGLPASYDLDGIAKTLVITLKDPSSKLGVRLYYGVFEEIDVITRAAEFFNEGEGNVVLNRVSSAVLDLPFGKWDLIHFHGRHCMERQFGRAPMGHFITEISSGRGMTSHQHNPFVILCDKDATEDRGDCYGMMLMYSGNFEAKVERGQMEDLRVALGIGSKYFAWNLAPGESFFTPEAILCHADGFASLSHRYHRFIRHHITRGKYHLAHRPILVNSWEAAYFDLKEDKLVALAQEAANLGIELFVLDDGWFKGRKDDNAGLGDWVDTPDRLPGGLKSLIPKVLATGMLFGIWIEPEMVNEESDLFRAHPDWALTVPGRKPTMGRNQLVLDMSRKDVVDYLFNVFSKLLSEHEISYVKWDFNRSLAEFYSRVLPATQQGEVAHRFVLGLYSLLDRLTSAFPEILFEGCAGGGGRFDAGMLYYTPQIWCSDDTDAIPRMRIQHGTSFGYPVSAMGSHVSAVPNHQTGRTTPLDTRGVVAMSGAFGYELDLTKMTEVEKEEVREQVRMFREDEALIHGGNYYRLTNPTEIHYFTAWEFVSEDKNRALVNLVMDIAQPNAYPLHIRLKGLDPDAVYRIEEAEGIYTGAALMYAGYSYPRVLGDYPSAQIHLTKVE